MTLREINIEELRAIAKDAQERGDNKTFEVLGKAIGYLQSDDLTLNEYQSKAMTTCTKSSENFAYMHGNLVGEVGEFSGKVAKAIRKNNGYFWNGRFCFRSNVEENEELLKAELGDVMWQVAGLASVQGWTLEELAEQNLAKLASRKDRGVIVGDGDER